MTRFNLGCMVNGISEWICTAPIICKIVSNPVFTALLITAFIAIILISLYKPEIKHVGTNTAIRAILYIFFIITATLSIHHYSTLRLFGVSTHQKDVRDVFSSIQQSRDVGNLVSVPVLPMGWKGGDINTDTFLPRPNNVEPENSIGPNSLNITDVVIRQ